MEREVGRDHAPSQHQLDILHKQPEAHGVFKSLSAPVQAYIRLNYESSEPTLPKEDRKALRAEVHTMAGELFGEENKDKGYNREMATWGDAIWMEIWNEEDYTPA